MGWSMWLKTTEHGVDMTSLPIRFNDEYIVIFAHDDVPSIPETSCLQIVSRTFEDGGWVENKKELFLEQSQLMMICNFFEGIKNERNK